MTTENLSVVLSLIAIVVSLYAAWTVVQTHREKLGDEAVVELYGQFEALSDIRLEHWETSHLFEVPSNYPQTSACIKIACEELDPKTKAIYTLKEFAVALRIFSFFEQVMYQHRLAKRHRDRRRAQFLQEVIDYFTSEWLRNPRLLHLWETGLAHRYETATVAYYSEHVLAGDGSKFKRDPEGPYV